MRYLQSNLPRNRWLKLVEPDERGDERTRGTDERDSLSSHARSDSPGVPAKKTHFQATFANSRRAEPETFKAKTMWTSDLEPRTRPENPVNLAFLLDSEEIPNSVQSAQAGVPIPQVPELTKIGIAPTPTMASIGRLASSTRTGPRRASATISGAISVLNPISSCERRSGSTIWPGP